MDRLTDTVTRDVTEHPRDLSRLYQERFKVSRVTATKYIQQLEREGWLARSGTRTHPVFSAGYRRRIGRTYEVHGLDEQRPWEEDFEPFFPLKPNVRTIAHHGFTEMVNNAIDHSQGTSVHCEMEQDAERLRIVVADDGIGIFRKIARALGLPDERLALLELSKGKLTTDPSRHSGEGVFFTSRMFDSFTISANDLHYFHDDGDRRDWLLEREATDELPGTWVFMEIALSSTRTTAEVFDQYSTEPGGFEFDKTVVPIRLARLGNEQLVSRSQAKRLIARFDRFRTIMIDFKGVDEIGQAFADELFRVYANDHPDIEIVPINMTEQIERMWRRALYARAHPV